ncbi:protein I'm not dead yet-like [Galleria mellonella]|uniref:Protein I'm not dead yet-like n=1 Tax=Galleria mellonella TaxID=7137 RepID=A0A6J3BY00_GALME|nr:protein I'm not dead yet-like [Galleria mellonella]
MGGLWSFFQRKDPKTPVKGLQHRIKNIAINNFRGLLGFFIPLFALSWQGERLKHDITVQCIWIWMFCFFLLQPVAVQVTGIIPIFILPMAGVLSTSNTCACYFNDSMALFILSGMLLLLLNNSGFDRRIALWLLSSGDTCQFSGKRLVFKCSTAAFFLSMFSNRLLVTSTLTEYMTSALTDLQSATSKYRSTEPDYDEMRYIINNAIQTASGIGSIAIIHATYSGLAFKGIWSESPPEGSEYPDIFNYLQYSLFAFPVAFIMYVLNFSYHMLLINWFVKKPMSASSMAEMQKSILKHKEAIPPQLTLHEKLTVVFKIVVLLVFFLRWYKFSNMGWANFNANPTTPPIPKVKDATVAALFVLLLHILPKGFGFMKYISAEKKSELPPLKPESAILWWRFVDKNTNYGYLFLLGAGVALYAAAKETELCKTIGEHLGKQFTDHNWNTSLFLVCLVTVILSNVMTSTAVVVVFLPFVLCMALEGQVPWPTKSYLGALAVGIGSSFGFMSPFLYTPAYLCHNTGKVPMLKMAKYSFLSSVICLIILWLALVYWGPFLWDPEDAGIQSIAISGAEGEGGGKGGGEGGAEGGGEGGAEGGG